MDAENAQIAELIADNESLKRHLGVAAANIERLAAANRELKAQLSRLQDTSLFATRSAPTRQD